MTSRPAEFKRCANLFVALLMSWVLVLTGGGMRGYAYADEVASESGQTGSASNLADIQTNNLEFGDLSDPELQRYVEDAVYSDLVDSLDSDDYFVENVETAYVSKEYLDELAYNSQANIYFGYTLAELEEAFQGQRYVFTLGEDGQTTVTAFEDYTDTFAQVMQNVAIGSGVILLCVTISAVTAGAGAPAISMIFAASAQTGTVFALETGAFAGAAASIARGIETGSVNEAVEAGVLAASEGFMWGAIGGAVTGGATEALALRWATSGGLTMREVATIQKESKYPLDVLKQFNSMEQYEICKNAGLVSKMVDGKTALVRDIDLAFKDGLGRTNLERMRQGLAALDPVTGEAYELHHIGQQADSTLAILTQAEHRLSQNNKIWHKLAESDVDHGAKWTAQRQAFWKDLAEAMG